MPRDSDCIAYSMYFTGEDRTTAGIPTTEEDVTDPEADTTSLRNLITTTGHETVATSTRIEDAGGAMTSDAATTDKTGINYKTNPA